MPGEQTKEIAFPSSSAPPFALPHGKSPAKEDVLRVAISFVKRDHLGGPIDFLSEVALTFEALSEGMRAPHPFNQRESSTTIL